MDVVVDTQPRAGAVDTKGMLSFQKLRVYHALCGTGSVLDSCAAMEAAAALDTMRVMKLLNETTHARGIDLLEGIVAMLTKMT